MKKSRKRLLIVFLALLFVIVMGILAYASFSSKERSSSSGGTRLKNPVEGLSDEEAVLRFNEDFVYYLLYSIKAYTLHNPPLSSDTPKIEIKAGDEVYNAEIVKGSIVVEKGESYDEDVLITTTKEEAVKMLRSGKYIEESFSQGLSNFAMTADKLELFSKGYLKLYEELTGNSAN